MPKTEAVPLVSVISAAFNVEKFIAETIESVRAQTYANWELIIVDDASKDGTAAVVESFVKKDPRIKLLRRSVSGGGPGPALNEATAVARGKYLAIQDSDDISLPTRLTKEVTFLEEHPEFDGVSCAVELVNEDGSVMGRTKSKPSDQTLIEFQILVRPQVIHGCMMVKKQALVDIGGYDPAYVPMDDYEIQCRLIAYGKKVSNLPDILYQYRMRGGSITHDERFISASSPKVVDIIIKNIELFMPTTRADTKLILDYIVGKPLGWGETFRAIGLYKQLVTAYFAKHPLPAPEASKIWAFYKNERNYHIRKLLHI